MTFTAELDDLIRFGHGDVKRLRDIRDTVKHDNFITIEDKKYVESLISTHLRNQPLDESEYQTTRQLPPKKLVSTGSSTFNFPNNKKLGITAGIAAAIALIVVAGFSIQTMDQADTSTNSETITTSNVPLAINIDNTSYKKGIITFSMETCYADTMECCLAGRYAIERYEILHAISRYINATGKIQNIVRGTGVWCPSGT